MSRQQKRSDKTIARVLHAALVCVDADEAPTIPTLVTRANTSVGSIYHHFGNLEGVLGAVYAACLLDLVTAMRDAVIRKRSARAAVEAAVNTYLRWSLAHKARARFIHASSYAGFVPNADALAAKRELLGEMAGRFAAWMAKGELTPLRPETFELLLIGPPAEAVRRWLLDPSLDLDAIARELAERIYAGLRTS